jgi:hypothetical protein
MGRKKIKEHQSLIYDIKTRVSREHFERLNKMLSQSRYRTMSELLRDIICKRPITIYTKDDSLNIVMSELVRIRKEINAVGNNINQLTRQVNGLSSEVGKSPLIIQAAGLFKETGRSIEPLLPIISQLANKWLQ